MVLDSGPGLADDAAAAASWVEREFGSDEFMAQVRLFADAPEPTGDGYTIRTLRTLSELFDWSNLR